MVGIIKNPEVADVFNNYPDHVRPKMMHLRQLILETADESDIVGEIEETLSWSEPSYKTKTGSTIRMDWKQQHPDQYAIYFTCSTSLVDTFRKLYSSTLKFQDNRAIVFDLSEKLPEPELRHFISLALTYHKVKHLSMLGV
ncbi:MAG: DUF1801 domain-containing protein [Balneolaceae bacterium]|nr:DUF1801 domain-containing protein [Balneolaceae bacterium]MDR9410057.1 DUF1801 domain-containing protein [Balneolaceae bacterium]